MEEGNGLEQKYKHFGKNVFLNFLVFSGWDSEMSSILLLIHLMPPSLMAATRDQESSLPDKPLTTL
jgi:hypothetical protein